jgi:hypothetical protein
MLEISFSWTWPAFVARAKTVTRRQWTSDYAARWKVGARFTALDKSRRFGGRVIGLGTIHSVYYEPIANMPDDDYVYEGFGWLHTHPECLPRSAAGQLWAQCTLDAFDKWRRSLAYYWVVRFEAVSITPEARARLDNLLYGEEQTSDLRLET